jgi:hypothetical protein
MQTSYFATRRGFAGVASVCESTKWPAPHPGAIKPERCITCECFLRISIYTGGIGNARRRSAAPPACSGPHGHSIDVVLLRHAPWGARQQLHATGRDKTDQQG